MPDTNYVTWVTNGLSGGAPGSTNPTFTTTGAPGGPQTLRIDLKDNRTILNWGGAWGGSGTGFDIAAGNTVDFKDARATIGVTGRTDNIAVLNRDLSNSSLNYSGPSNILGTLRSDPNVAVYIINTQGLVFGGSSVVDTGSFFASSLDTTDADFFNGDGRLSLSGPNTPGRISVANGANFRTAAVSGSSGDRIGDLVLVAHGISLGTATLRAGGDIALAHAQAITFQNAPGSPLSFVIDGPAGDPNFRSSANITGRNVSIGLSYYQPHSLTMEFTGGSIEATGASVTDRGVVLSVAQAAPGIDYAPGTAFNGRIISSNMSVTSAKNIDARADGIFLGDLTAAGNINLSGGTSTGVSVRDLAAGTASISGRSISARNLTTRSGPVTFSGESVGITQDLNVAADLTFSGIALSVGGNSTISGTLDLDLTGSTRFGNIQADKVDINAAGSIHAGNVHGLHGVRLVTPFRGNGLGGQLRVGTVSAAASDGDVFLQGDLVFSITDPGTSPPTPRDRITISAGRDIGIRSGDSLLLANVVAGRNLYLSAGHIDALRLEATAGSAEITALKTWNNRSNKGVATIDTLQTGSFATVEGTNVALRAGSIGNMLSITGEAVQVGAASSLSDLFVGSSFHLYSSGSALIRGNVTSGQSISVFGTTVTVGNTAAPGAQLRAKSGLYLTATTSGIQGIGNVLLMSDSDGTAENGPIFLSAMTGITFTTGTTLRAGPNRESDLRIRSAMNSAIILGNLSARSIQSGTFDGAPLVNGIVRNAGVGFLGQVNLTQTLLAQGTSIAANGPITVTAGNIDLRSTSGISVNGALNASGDVSAVTNAGNLTVGTNGAFTGSNILLSTSGAFINNGGANIMAGAGRWLVYSANPAGNTFGGLDSGNTAIWNGTLATRPPSTITGNRYVFVQQPTLTFSTIDFSKVYGTDLNGSAAIPFAVSGYHAGVAGAFLGDTAATSYSGSPLIQSAGFAERAGVAGGPYAQTIAQGSVQSTSGYALAFAPSTGLVTVTPRAITGSIVVDNKIYDGNTGGTGSVSLGGVLVGDDVGTTGSVFTFADKNAGTGKAVNVTGTTLSGADGSNYTLTIPASVLADILQKALTATVTANGKTYDGTTAATGSVALNGVVAGDSVGTTGSAFTFADKNAGTGKAVNVTGTALSGADAGNYTLTVPASALADILKKALTATATANGKTYDGTTAATGTVALNGVVAGDSVGTSGTTFTFVDKNAGTGKTVNIAGATLNGTDSGNYTLTIPATVLADIAKRALSVSADDKEKYTGDADPALTYTITLGSLVAGDQLTGALARAAGEAPGGYAIGQGGLSAGGNYTLTFTPGTLTLSVNPATSQPQTLRAVPLPSGIQVPSSAGSSVSVDANALCANDTSCVVN